MSWKLSSTVLRGGANGNVGSPLGVRTGKAKQPFHFGMQDDSLFAFAGIWDRWKDGAGNPVETCSILTTTPNSLLAVVHDRMPVISNVMITNCGLIRDSRISAHWRRC